MRALKTHTHTHTHTYTHIHTHTYIHTHPFHSRLVAVLILHEFQKACTGAKSK